MSDQDASLEPASGVAISLADGHDEATEVEYVRRSYYLPRPLVERLEAEAREADGDSSRILAEALVLHLGREASDSLPGEAAPRAEAPAAGTGTAETTAASTASTAPAGGGPPSDAATPAGPPAAGAPASGPESAPSETPSSGTDALEPAAAAPDAGSPKTPDPGSPPAETSTRQAQPPEDPAPTTGGAAPAAEPGTLDLPEGILNDEAIDLAESLHARLSLLGDVSLDAPPVRETLLSVSRVIERRDAFSDGHAEGVATLAAGVARAMDLAPRDALAIELGGLAHELGKLAVPRSILSKKGKLTAAERETMRRYPEVAARLLDSIPVLRPLEPIVLHHQERWDGSGYPSGLSGDDIPLGAQIVGIADAYHALTSARSYRPALDSDQARNTVREASGRLWNPRVASALIRHVQSQD